LDEDDILEEDEIFVHLTCPEINDGLAGHVPTWVKTSKASIAPKVREHFLRMTKINPKPVDRNVLKNKAEKEDLWSAHFPLL
jgi:hypothetical protein